jgi:membrane peptidoglycan carboxypeptidase
MYKNAFFLLIFVFLAFNLNAAYSISKNGYALLLLGNDALAPESGWTNHAETAQLINYGTSRDMVLVDDARPVANSKASYIAAPGVTFMVQGFEPQKTYYMWIDFVRFTFKKNPGIYSKLMVFVDGRQVDELTWGEISTDRLYKIELPLDLTYDGSANITFKENSMNYGHWGIWDIIVASGNLPEGSYFADDVQNMNQMTPMENPTSERPAEPQREELNNNSNSGAQPSPQTQSTPNRTPRERSNSNSNSSSSSPTTSQPRRSSPQRSTPRRTTPPRQTQEPQVPTVDAPTEPVDDGYRIDMPQIPDPPGQ